mmetsp:Transcript_20162/g.59897  ORF Transcript_20162/g.59897 Transcript_20162/m.59897 type:complete len:381 (-) Transcript_20162:1317-2459(-)
MPTAQTRPHHAHLPGFLCVALRCVRALPAPAILCNPLGEPPFCLRPRQPSATPCMKEASSTHPINPIPSLPQSRSPASTWDAAYRPVSCRLSQPPGHRPAARQTCRPTRPAQHPERSQRGQLQVHHPCPPSQQEAGRTPPYWPAAARTHPPCRSHTRHVRRRRHRQLQAACSQLGPQGWRQLFHTPAGSRQLHHTPAASRWHLAGSAMALRWRLPGTTARIAPSAAVRQSKPAAVAMAAAAAVQAAVAAPPHSPQPRPIPHPFAPPQMMQLARSQTAPLLARPSPPRRLGAAPRLQGASLTMAVVAPAPPSLEAEVAAGRRAECRPPHSSSAPLRVAARSGPMRLRSYRGATSPAGSGPAPRWLAGQSHLAGKAASCGLV